MKKEVTIDRLVQAMESIKLGEGFLDDEGTKYYKYILARTLILGDTV